MEESIKAKAIVSTIDPFQTFLKYVGEDKLDKGFVSQINNFKPEAWSLLNHAPVPLGCT